MRLKPVSPAADCSFCLRTFASKNLFKSRPFTKVSRGDTIRRPCSLNLDNKSSFHVEAMSISPREEEGRRRKKRHCAISNEINTIGSGRDKDSFLETRFDFLEPMMLGIRPEFPEWPDRETAAWAMVEQKANSFDIPLSLRMIKKRLQLEEGSASEAGEAGYCSSVKAAFASMVLIVVEMQSHALHLREALCDEDLGVITSKVQKEMRLSFVWLFQHVFSRTPALMLQVMLLLADFSLHSISEEASLLGQVQQCEEISPSLSDRGLAVEEEAEGCPSIYPSNEFGSDVEMQLWGSMVGEANDMRGGGEGEVFLDHDVVKHFVSPVSVEIEPDTYPDFYRTDLLYQMNLSLEPSNTLLLLNYARFLQLVARDYQR